METRGQGAHDAQLHLNWRPNQACRCCICIGNASLHLCIGLDWIQMHSQLLCIGLHWILMHSQLLCIGLDWIQMHSQLLCIGLDWIQMHCSSSVMQYYFYIICLHPIQSRRCIMITAYNRYVLYARILFSHGVA